MKKTEVIFPANAIKKNILKMVVKEQTERLILYAEERIKKIGDDISVAQTRHNLDRTGNLLDSVCWGVCYGGKLKKYGYYRNETAYEDSHLHEYSRPMGEVVNGREKASMFIAQYKPKIHNGWEVFFAVLAPYWGYWETGFTHPSGREFHWFVMTSHYDSIASDLKPSAVRFNIYKP